MRGYIREQFTGLSKCFGVGCRTSEVAGCDLIIIVTDPIIFL